MELMKSLNERIVGNPHSTLGGTVVGALILALQSLVANVDWTDLRQAIGSGVSAALPVLIGALYKGVPQGDPVIKEMVAGLQTASVEAAQRAAKNAGDQLIAKLQEFGTTQGGEPADKKTA